VTAKELLTSAAWFLGIEAIEEVECRYCGFAESLCICDQLCFWAEYPGSPPCLEPKENPSDETCKYHVEDAAADRAADVFGGDPK
jgi:hypothetical protein